MALFIWSPKVSHSFYCSRSIFLKREYKRTNVADDGPLYVERCPMVDGRLQI